MTIPILTETAIRQQSDTASFDRGREYYRRGAVVSLVRRGDTLEAEVQGSDYAPYRIRIDFDAGGVTEATCTCPYDWGGWCKHIVAALLAYLHEPEAAEVRPVLEEQLASLSREQLQALLLELAARDPELIDRIETQLAVIQATVQAAPGRGTAATPPEQRAAIDPEPFRRKVRAALRSLDRMSASEGDVVDELHDILKPVQEFIEAGDGHNALAVLEAITGQYPEDWIALDDSEGEASALFSDLGALWTEALLTADLSPDQREQWWNSLSAWQDQLSDYGVDDAFVTAMRAAEEGWDDPRLQQALRGEKVEQEASEQGVPWYTRLLTHAWLKVLERRQQFQEYLNLAKAQGEIGRYVTLLVRLGRVQEAVDEGLRLLTTAQDAFELAKALLDRGELKAALAIAEHGVTLEGPKGAIAAWLRDLATELGETERALAAAVIAFREAPSLDAYLKVQDLAGGRWQVLRTQLLDYLRTATAYIPQAQVEVFLHEGLIDDAIAAVRKSMSYELLAKVMDAAVAHRPDWVIQAARAQAEAIMDAGRSGAYVYAIDWLKRAQAAYRAAGREVDWQAYLGDLRTRHQRKYKLMALLKAL